MSRCCFFAAISFVILSLTFLKLPEARAQSSSQHGSDQDNDGASNVAYITIDEDTLEMNVKTNGELAQADLELPTRVKKASVRSERDITCFFWMGWSERATVRYNHQLLRPVSSSFSTGEKLSESFSFAERLYCYDSTNERESDDTFTLFVENVSQTNDLVRLKARQSAKPNLSADDEPTRAQDKKMENLYAILDLREPYPDLRKGVISLSLIRSPTAPRQFFWNNAYPRNMCTALWRSNRGGRFHAAQPLYLAAPEDLLRITCYRAIDSESARQNWMRTRWMID